jgi:hypothetical protein
MIDPATKREFPLISILYAACILLALASSYTYFSEKNVDVRRSPRLEGKVESAYLTPYWMRTTRSHKWVTIFAFRLDQSPQTLGVWWTSANYITLINSVHVGDEVTVYYKPSTASGVNLDVFQIEKGNAIILDYENYRRYSIAFAYESGGLAVFIFLVAQVVVWVRKRRVAD